MSRDHGGYDLNVRVSQRIITQIAQATFSMAPVTRKFPEGMIGPGDTAAGTITLDPRLSYLWFTEEPRVPRRWNPGKSRPWPDQSRQTTDLVTLVLDLGDVGFELTGYRDPITGAWVDRTDPNAPGFASPEARRVDLRGYLQITDRVETRRMRVTPVREDPAIAVDAWCTLLDFSRDPARGLPSVDVWLDPDWAFRDLTNPTATMLYLTGLGTIEQRIQDEIPSVLAGLTDFRLPGAGLLPLSVSVLTGGDLDPTNVVARTERFSPDPTRTADSALSSYHRIASTGEPTRLGTWPEGVGDMNITIANEFLLRSLIFDALAKTFTGLTEDFIYDGVPIVLKAPLEVPAKDPYTLRRLNVLTSENSTILISGELFVDRGFASTTATIAIDLSFTAATTVSEGVPVLRITPVVTRAAVVDSHTSIAWWAAMLPIANFFFGIASLIVGRIVTDTIEAMLPTDQEGIDVSLPGGVRFSVSDVSLNQSDSPKAFPTLPFIPIRAHDLVISVVGTPLPDTLIVSCIERDSSDPQRRIDAVGGILDDGTEWGLAVDDAIAAIRAGKKLFVSNDDGTQTPIEVVQGGAVPYLRTKPDAAGGNNLLDLPDCRA